MTDQQSNPAPSKPRRGRGGVGKYLRARGRGRGGGRAAEWGTRLVLEDEQTVELEDEDAAEIHAKYSRRELGTNADRYEENKNTDENGEEEEPEPEVDLTAFLARQRESGGTNLDLLVEAPSQGFEPKVDPDDVDHSLAHISSRPQAPKTAKCQVSTIEFDEDLQAMSLDKSAAEAVSDLKARFKGQPSSKPSPRRTVRAPSPPPDGSKPSKPQMEGFLDDLLS